MIQNTRTTHINFIANNPMIFQVSLRGFSENEVRFIEKYGKWLEALRTGELEPITPKQKEVVEELNSRIKWQECKTEAGTWKKYLRRQIVEKNGDVMQAPPPSLEDHSFGTREEFEAMRRGQFSTMAKNHRS